MSSYSLIFIILDVTLGPTYVEKIMQTFNDYTAPDIVIEEPSFSGFFTSQVSGHLSQSVPNTKYIMSRTVARVHHLVPRNGKRNKAENGKVKWLSYSGNGSRVKTIRHLDSTCPTRASGTDT